MTAHGHCPNCGEARPADAVFCVSCGFALPPESPAAVASPTAEVHGAPPDERPSATASHAQPDETIARQSLARHSLARHSLARHSLLQLAVLVVGVSIGVGAVAVALTLALTPPAVGTAGSSGAGGELQVVEVANIRAEVPKAWVVARRAGDTIAVHDQARRVLWLRSARLPAALSLDMIQEQALKRARNRSPDARVCAGPDGAPVPGGPADGRYFVICYTFIPQGGGPAVPLADAYYVGTGSAAATFMMQLTAAPEALEAFAGTVRQLPAPVWKLLGG